MPIGDHHQAETWAIKALERIKQEKLSPLPENYALFYYYFSNTIPELKTALDAAGAGPQGLSQQLCSGLYNKFLGVEIERRMLRETNDALDQKLKHVLQILGTANLGNEQYTKSLDQFSGRLSETISVDQIRDAVTTVVNQTRAMVQQNELLHEQLERTTTQLSEVRTNLDKAHQESQLDPLTEIGNRKFFDHEMQRALAEASETKNALTILMVDVDHFKRFNDSYGHLIGDQVLRLVARTLVENLKGRDIIARYGGEEFVILLPQTRLADAEKVANLLRASLATKQIRRRSTNQTLGNITISIGAAEFDYAEDSETFVGRADRAMYMAKQTGRNRVVCDLPKPGSLEPET